MFPLFVEAQAPQGTLSANGPFCGSGTGKLSWTATAGTGPFSVIYNDGISNRTESGVVSGTSFSVFKTPVTTTTIYTLVSVTDAGGFVRSSGFTGNTATITVKPRPDVIATPSSQTICSGAGLTTVVLTSSVNGATFAWTRDNIDGITGSGGVSGFGGNGNISGSFTSTSSVPETVGFQVVPTYNGCSGAALAVSVVVNNSPAVNAISNQAVCGGTGTAAINFTGTASTYSWTNSTSSIGLASNGNGNIASFTAINSGTTTKTATITVTPKSGTCTGSQKTFNIIVNPVPALTSTLAAASCSGSIFDYTPTTNASGVATFNWSRAAVSGISNAASIGSGNISETLVNTTSSAKNVTYVYTVSVDNNGSSCTNTTTYSVVVSIKPTPTVAISPSGNQSICSGTAITPVTITNPNGLAGTTFSWTRTNGATSTGNITGMTAAGSGNPISGTLDNEGLIIDTTVFTAITSNNGCASFKTFNVRVTLPIINNKILAADISELAFCGLTKQITIASPAPHGGDGPFTYQWQASSPGNGNYSNIAGATDSTLVYNSNSDVYFRRIAYSGGCSNTSGEKLVSASGGNASSISGACTGGSGIDISVGASYKGAKYVLYRTTSIPGEWRALDSITGTGSKITFDGRITVATYKVIVTKPGGGCTTDVNGTFDIVPGMLPTAPTSATATPPIICLGSSTDLVATIAGASVNWYTVPVEGDIINSSPIPGGAPYTVTPGATTTYYAKSIIEATGCKSSGRTSVKVIVNPTPFMTSEDTVDICTGSMVSIPLTDNIGGGTTYSWVAADNPNTTGESTTPQSTTTLSNTITNNTNALQMVTYTVIPTVTVTGCSGVGQPQTVVVNVAPMPVIIPQTAVVCSGTGFVISPANGGGNTVPVSPATQYTWAAPTGTGLAGGVSGTGESITGTPTNTTNATTTATYNVVPAGGGCTGATFTATITINPTPVIVNQTIAACSGSVFSMPAGQPFGGSNIIPAGTVYSWGAPVGTNISGIAAGSNQTTISGNLTNTSAPAIPVTATYTVIPTGPVGTGSCAGNSFNLVATIYPTLAANTAIWTGAVSSDWCNAANWVCGQVPDESVNAIIPTGAANQPAITGSCDAIVKDINVQGTAALNLGAGRSLDIYGAVINTNPARYTLNGTVTFAGGDQDIPGFTYSGLRFSGGGLKTLTAAALVNGNLSLNNGIVITSNSNMLTVTSSGTINAGSDNSYIEGPLTRLTNSTASYNFPVGGNSQVRNAYVVPVSNAASSYTVLYHHASPAFNGVVAPVLGIQMNEYWDILRNSGADAVVGMDYKNPNGLVAGVATSDWSGSVNPCDACKVAVVDKDANNNWSFTGGSGGFGAGETTYWQTNNRVNSRLLGGNFGQFTFGYAPETILAVQLVYFNGTLQGNNSVLDWKYASSADVSSTELQHSTDGRRFEKLANIDAAGRDDYKYTHRSIQTGAHFYRLNIKDKAGKLSYSRTVLLIAGKTITVIKGLNPTMVGSTTYADIHSAVPQEVKATLVDVTGRTMGYQRGNLFAGDNNFRVNTQMLVPGIYSIRLQTTDGTVASFKFVKQ
ncbi:hypothetical protein BH10BAC3_BH10BAC3_09730 [soil metagenome]